MSPKQALQALVLANYTKLRERMHPTRRGLTALDYAHEQLAHPRTDAHLRRVTNTLRRLLGLEVPRGRPARIGATRYISVSLRAHRFVRSKAEAQSVSAVAAVAALLDGCDPVSTGQDESPACKTLRVPVESVKRHGGASGVRRALARLYRAAGMP